MKVFEKFREKDSMVKPFINMCCDTEKLTDVSPFALMQYRHIFQDEVHKIYFQKCLILTTVIWNQWEPAGLWICLLKDKGS